MQRRRLTAAEAYAKGLCKLDVRQEAEDCAHCTPKEPLRIPHHALDAGQAARVHHYGRERLHGVESSPDRHRRRQCRQERPGPSSSLRAGNWRVGERVGHSASSSDNPPSINPDHLRLGSKADNSRDMMEKGRSAKGEAHSQSNLTEAGVRLIRELHRRGRSRSRLSREFGLSVSCIREVVLRISWGWVSDYREHYRTGEL